VGRGLGREGPDKPGGHAPELGAVGWEGSAPVYRVCV